MKLKINYKKINERLVMFELNELNGQTSVVTDSISLTEYDFNENVVHLSGALLGTDSCLLALRLALI